MNRVYNFNAGPAVLPLEVLEEAQAELLDYQNLGMSVLEMSHRSKAYDAINDEAQSDLKDLLGLGDDYDVLFIQGGATLQFSMVPLNFLTEGSAANYILTGVWAEKALDEAKKVGNTHVAASTKAENYCRLPKAKEVTFSDNMAYLHVTSNNTIFGTQWRGLPDFGLDYKKTRLVADMSSDILSYPIKASDYSLIYAGAQKNIGPAGLTVVIIRKELAEESPKNLPTMLKYDTFSKTKSLHNTPPAFSVYLTGKVLKWIKRSGGLSAMATHNETKASLVYEVIDKHPDFFNGHAHKEDRSYMNITFRLPSEELEAKFVSEATASGFVGLKGHRSVGGLRVSIYNGMPKQGCADLATFMLDFMKKS